MKSVEDVADCATDDLVGWTERAKEKGSEAVRHKGVLEGFEISRQEAEDIIMSARVLAGWITAEDLEAAKAAEVEAAEVESAGDDAGADQG